MACFDHGAVCNLLRQLPELIYNVLKKYLWTEWWCKLVEKVGSGFDMELQAFPGRVFMF